MVKHAEVCQPMMMNHDKPRWSARSSARQRCGAGCCTWCRAWSRDGCRAWCHWQRTSCSWSSAGDGLSGCSNGCGQRGDLRGPLSAHRSPKWHARHVRSVDSEQRGDEPGGAACACCAATSAAITAAAGGDDLASRKGASYS